MFQEGELLRFSPFIFKNGSQPKPKYFIVLGYIDNNVMMASLPTSQDHVPADVVVERGCVDIRERGVNAYVFNPADLVTPTFRFPLPTFVYGEQVDEYEQTYLDSMNSVIEHLGVLDSQIFSDLKECLKRAVLIRRKYKALL